MSLLVCLWFSLVLTAHVTVDHRSTTSKSEKYRGLIIICGKPPCSSCDEVAVQTLVVCPSSALPIIIPPPPPPTTPPHPKLPDRLGGAAVVASKSVPTFCQAHRDLLQGAGVKTEPFICTLGPYCQTLTDCSVAISSCFDWGRSGEWGGHLSKVHVEAAVPSC